MPNTLAHGTNAVYGGAIGASIAAVFGVSLSVVCLAALGSILSVSILQKFSLKIGFLIIISATSAAAFLTPYIHSNFNSISMEGIAFFTSASGIAFWGHIMSAINNKIDSFGKK